MTDSISYVVLFCCYFRFFFSTKCAPFKYFRFTLALWKNKSDFFKKWCYGAFSFFKLITLDYNWHKFLNIREINSVYFTDKWVKNNGRNYLSCWKRVKFRWSREKKSRCSFGLILFVLMTTEPLAIANKYTLFQLHDSQRHPVIPLTEIIKSRRSERRTLLIDVLMEDTKTRTCIPNILN